MPEAVILRDASFTVRTSSELRFEGLTLLGGLIDDEALVLIDQDSSVTFDNVIASDLNNDAVLAMGTTPCRVTPLNSDFRDSTDGGGVRLEGPHFLLVENCTFVRLSKLTRGSAIYANATSSVEISGCRFEQCIAMSGIVALEAVFYETIQNCLFSGNKAWDVGGALYLGTKDGAKFSLIKNLLFCEQHGKEWRSFEYPPSHYQCLRLYISFQHGRGARGVNLAFRH